MRLVENEEWVEQQFEGCDLNNSMRTQRLKKAARNMLGDPNGSLPKQNCNWSDVKAVYRLLDREEVTFDAVRRRHLCSGRHSLSDRRQSAQRSPRKD